MILQEVKATQDQVRFSEEGEVVIQDIFFESTLPIVSCLLPPARDMFIEPLSSLTFWLLSAITLILCNLLGGICRYNSSFQINCSLDPSVVIIFIDSRIALGLPPVDANLDFHSGLKSSHFDPEKGMFKRFVKVAAQVKTLTSHHYYAAGTSGLLSYLLNAFVLP